LAWATNNKAGTLTPIACTSSTVSQSDWIYNQSNESFLAQDGTSDTLTLQNYSPACSGTGTSYTPPSNPTTVTTSAPSNPPGPTVYTTAGVEAGNAAPIIVSYPVSLPVASTTTIKETKLVVIDLSSSKSITTWVAADMPLFAFDQARLSIKARVELAPLHKALTRLAKTESLKRVVITGFAADGGSKYERFSRHLGYERAKAVDNFLFGGRTPKHVVVIARSGPRSLVLPKHLTKRTHKALVGQLAMQRRVEIQVTVAR
jgi:outer membrane protein OmpA-like peptidoglycan-associated protein